VSGDGKAIGGFEIEDELGPRTVSGGSKRGPLEPGVEVDDGPEKFRSWTEKGGLAIEIGEGEIAVGKTEGRENVGT